MCSRSSLAYTAIVGSRQLPPSAQGAVREAVGRVLADPRAGIVTGGAMGADHFAIRALIEFGQCRRGLIVTPWQGFEGFPYLIRQEIRRFAASGGHIEWGLVPTTATPGSPGSGTNRAQVVAGLFGRNRRIIERACAVIAFRHGVCNGTNYTIQHAIERGVPVTVVDGPFASGGGRVPLPQIQMPLFQHPAPA